MSPTGISLFLINIFFTGLFVLLLLTAVALLGLLLRADYEEKIWCLLVDPFVLAYRFR